MSEPIRLFVAGSCRSCDEVKQLMSEGRCNLTPDEVIDVEEEGGREWTNRLRFTNGVPAAFQGNKQCQLRIDDGERKLIIKCPGSKD